MPLFEKTVEHATVRTCFLGSRFNNSTFLTLSMSQHRSLKGASTIAAKRNVLKRFERVDLLKKRGQWKETSKVIGLPKTKPDV
jgi:small basic protein (TIGR04137 family)